MKITYEKINNKISNIDFNLIKQFNSKLNKFERVLKIPKLNSRPEKLTIETTNSCNSKCVMCLHPVHKRNGTLNEVNMKWDIFNKTRPFWKYAKKIELGGNGEPFLHPNYLQMAKEIKKNNCFIHCFTNGILLDEKISKSLVEMKYDQISISIGGATRKTYKYIRGVDGFERVINNLKKLKEIKRLQRTKKPEVHFNIAGMKSVLNELDAIIHIAAEHSVTSIDMFHLLVFFDHVRKESFWVDIEKTKEKMECAKETAKKCGVRLSLPTFTPFTGFCDDPFNRFIICSDGTIVSCTGHRFILGDIKEDSIYKIWNSYAWVKLREQIYKRGYKDVCPECPSWQPNRKEFLLNVTGNMGQLTVDLREEEKINKYFRK